MRMKSLLKLCVLVACAAPLHAASTFIQLDFGEPSVTAPAGYTKVTGNFLANTPTASATNIDGLGYNFTVGNVGVFSFGSAANPLTTDGFYTFGNDTQPHVFTLSGLTPGQTVALYALAAWDGNGRGAAIDFGGSTTVAQTVGTPGTTPTLANFTYIGTAVADLSGNVSGTMNGNGFPGNAATEGQLGGMIFELGAGAMVPEPSSALLVGCGMFAFVMRRRKG